MTEHETLERLANRLRILSERGLNTRYNCATASFNYFPHTHPEVMLEKALLLLESSGYSFEFMPTDLAAIPLQNIQEAIVSLSDKEASLLKKRLWQVPAETCKQPKVFDSTPITEADIPY